MSTPLRSEWRLLARDRLVVLTLAVLLLCLLFAARSGAQYREAWQQSAATLEHASRAQLQGDIADLRANKPDDTESLWPPGMPSSVRIAIPAAVPPLAHFSIGQSDLYPRSAEASMWNRTDNLFRQYQLQSPLTLASGRFDLAYVVVAVLPLLAIVLCFDLLAADRVSGRLSLLAVQAGGLGTLVARRLWLRGALLMAPLLLLLAWGLASGAPPAPLLLWTGLAMLYALFWLLLCALIALRPTRPETQAAQLVALWLLLVLALPAGINRLVETLVPPPSQQALQTSLREAEIRANRKAVELLHDYLSDHPELSAQSSESHPEWMKKFYAEWMKKYYAVARKLEAETRPVVEAHQTQLTRARTAAQFMQFLSPAAAVQVALSDAAGTGPEQQAAYVAAARAYQVELQARVSPALYRGVRLSADELSALPEFLAPCWTPAHGGAQLLAVFSLLSGLCGLLAWRLRRAAAALSPMSI